MLGFTEAMKYFFLICCFCFVLLILLIACDMLRDICARIKQKLKKRKYKEISYVITKEEIERRR